MNSRLPENFVPRILLALMLAMWFCWMAEHSHGSLPWMIMHPDEFLQELLAPWKERWNNMVNLWESFTDFLGWVKRVWPF